MMISNEEHEKWIRGYLEPRYPELVEPYRDSLEGFEHIVSNNQIDEKSLASIANAVSSPRIPLATSSLGYLRVLGTQYEEAREAISLLCNSTHWHIRQNALACLNVGTPIDFAIPLLRKGLQDESYRVRRIAAYIIRVMEINELIPDLEKRLSVEENPIAKREINFSFRLLRDGFCLMNLGNRLHIWMWENEGRISGLPLTLRGLPKILCLFLNRRRP